MRAAELQIQCPLLQRTAGNETPIAQQAAVQSRYLRNEACVEPVGLSAIYAEDVNLAVWRRELTAEQQQAARHIVNSPLFSSISAVVSVDSIAELLQSRLPNCDDKQAIVDDAVFLVDLFTCLFDLSQVGFRMSRLDRVMCPRFHVDHVPCRLVTTYVGSATEWLPDDKLDRRKLGLGNNGLPDHISGIYQHQSDISQLMTGYVALFKGEKWIGNEGGGLVHRSPQAASEEKRLLLTLDFA